MNLTEFKVCRECKILKATLDDFYYVKRDMCFKNICKACERPKHNRHYYKNREKNLQRVKERYIVRREEIIKYKSSVSKNQRKENKEKIFEFLEKNPCGICGESRPACLQFHHTGEKESAVSNLRIFKWARIEKEITKCQVLCSNCHKHETAREQNWYSWMGETPAQDKLGDVRTKRYRTHVRRVYDFKAANQCVDCGEADPVVLEFDHVRGKKFKTISRMLPVYSWARIEDEMAKCEIRCGNCHVEKTSKELGWYN